MTIAIATLGGFAVSRCGATIPADRWQSRKARDVVKILAARRGCPVPREQLADLLWPGDPWERTANRLCVALSTARAVFDPRRSEHRDTYLITEQCAVRLNPDTVHVDIDTFVADCDRAMTAARARRADTVPLLEAAVAAYPGDFCETDPYEPWAEGPRLELRARYHDIVAALADELTKSSRPADAVPHLTHLLARDPYDEAAHRRLVLSLRDLGRHGAALDAHRTYVRRMAELGVPAVDGARELVALPA